MARSKETKIELTAYDDLFETDQSREEAKLSIKLWRWYDEQRRKEMCPVSESNIIFAAEISRNEDIIVTIRHL